jgi:hypothetical protein
MTDNGNVLMHGKAPATWINGQTIAHDAAVGALHSIRSGRVRFCGREVN